MRKEALACHICSERSRPVEMKFNPGEKKMNQTAYDDLKTYY